MNYLEFSGISSVKIWFLHETEKDDVLVLQSKLMSEDFKAMSQNEDDDVCVTQM